MATLNELIDALLKQKEICGGDINVKIVITSLTSPCGHDMDDQPGSIGGIFNNGRPNEIIVSRPFKITPNPQQATEVTIIISAEFE